MTNEDLHICCRFSFIYLVYKINLFIFALSSRDNASELPVRKGSEEAGNV